MSEVPLYVAPPPLRPAPFTSVLYIFNYRGTLPIKKHSPPYDPPKTLGIGLRKDPRGVNFLVSEVPLYAAWRLLAWLRRASFVSPTLYLSISVKSAPPHITP